MPSPLANLVAHLLHGDPLIISVDCALVSLDAANAIVLSSHLSKWIPLPVDARAYDKFLTEKRRKFSGVRKRIVEDKSADPGLAAGSAIVKTRRVK